MHPLGEKECGVFLQCTLLLWDSRGASHNIPFQCVSNPLVFEIPDMCTCTKGGAIPASVSHVLIMTSVQSSLEGLACGACVGKG